MTINPSALDLLELPDVQRDVFLHVARHGVADVEGLAVATGYPPDEVRQALAALEQRGFLAPTAQGPLEAVFGRVMLRTRLPAELDGALAATGRLYSEQEVAVLRTALPMLQFARAHLTQFADHSPSHALRVQSFATQLGYLLGLMPAEPLLDRIAADDRDYFLQRADRFAERYAAAVVSPEPVGRVLLFRELPGAIPPASYWAMERAIEQRGRVPVRRFAFNMPYAVGVWPAAGEEMELLAINHWREEEAIPIRFLYPPGFEPVPHGHEGIVHVRLAKKTA